MSKLEKLQRLSEDIGFDAVGVCPLADVDPLQKEAFEEWIASGHQAGMSYLERNREVRYNPTYGNAILEGAKSVIVIAASYFPAVSQKEDAPKISKYAYGADYHCVLKERLEELGRRMEETFGLHRYRAIVDTVPFLERYWAERAGLGFIGRNRNLILKGRGSFFFLGELLTTLEFETEERTVGLPGTSCGSCRRCIEACPTGALSERGFDARRCISYLTIEHRGEVPAELAGLFGDRFYGCDTCQDVCPFNHRPPLSRFFEASEPVLGLSDEDLKEFTKEKYKALVKGSALSRARFDQMKRNAEIYLMNRSKNAPL